MKTAIERVVVFALAFQTHRKFLHRRVGAIIGQLFDNRETWTAVCAVRERIAKSPIGWVENLAQAIRARRNIRENQRRFVAAILALPDFESAMANCIKEG